MTDMIKMAIEIHLFSIFLILAIILWALFVLKSDKKFEVLSKKYEAVSLYYRAVLGALFFTGLVVMAVAKFDVSMMVYVMVLVTLIMIATTIKENVVYKSAHIKDLSSQKRFKSFAKKKYIADFIMIAVTGGISYAVSL